MNQDLKKLIDALIEAAKTGAKIEVLAQVQYIVQSVPQETLVTWMNTLPKRKIIDMSAALPLAWKNSNELSDAEGKKIAAICYEILVWLIGAAFAL
jgi:hypothetical protein